MPPLSTVAPHDTYMIQSSLPEVQGRTTLIMWDVSQKNPQLLIEVLMFILIQASELCADFRYKYSDVLCVHTQTCIPAHEPSICEFCSIAFRSVCIVRILDEFWHFDHLSYFCRYKSSFPWRAQQPFHSVVWSQWEQMDKPCGEETLSSAVLPEALK